MMRMWKQNLLLVCGLLLLVTVACTAAPPTPGESGPGQIAAPPPTATPTPEGEAPQQPAEAPPAVDKGEAAFQDQLDRGEVALESLEAVTEEISGPVLLLQVTNPTDDEVLVTLPCGLIFQPADEEEQRLMVIQPAEVSLPAGGEGELQPYVICIDAHRGGPSLGSGYSLGVMASEDLLTLARCICDKDLATLEEEMRFDELMGLQMAVWMTSSGADDMAALFDYAGEGEESALGGLADEELDFSAEELQEYLAMLTDLFGASTQDWLARCGLQPEN